MVLMALVLVGLAGLIVGSGLAVGGAVAIAKRARVSPMVVGLTVTSVGTSLPEIATNLAVAVNSFSGLDASGIAVGNVIGSNLSQITLFLGIAGVVGPLSLSRSSLRRDGTMLVLAMLMMFVAAADGHVHRWEGGLLVAAYIAYLVWVFFRTDDAIELGEDVAPSTPILPILARTAAGLLLVVLCADLVVNQGVAFARTMSVPEGVIGLLVGVGTGLPELTVSLRAINTDGGSLSIGNLIGSNITDPLLSFGLGALVYPISVSATALTVDFPFWIASTLTALLLLQDGLTLTRQEAGSLLILFGLFVYVRIGLIGS